MGPEDVRAAAARLAGRVVRTPMVRSRELDELAGAELFLKAENLQHINAFKARGALNATLVMDPALRARGLITYSSGNHAQAVALAAREHGVRADVAMPTDAPAIKVARVRALGAHVTFAGTTSAERREAAIAIQARTGGAMVEPFDDPSIIAGQGTATLELREQVADATGADLDALLVPVGGGGLVAGACLACDGTPTRVWAVEPVGCDAMGKSLAAGERVVVEPGPTLADGLKPVRVGARNFEIAQRRLAGALTVDDREIGAALVRLLMWAKLLVEPSGAAAMAAALRPGLAGSPRRIGVILSGGNVEPDLLARLIREHAAAPAT